MLEESTAQGNRASVGDTEPEFNVGTNSKYSRIEPANLKEFSWCQKIFVVIMGLILLYLFSFIIYMCFTWNKIRINEYA